MNSKLLFAVLGFACLTQAATNHPVRHELVQEIKEKTSRWVPREVHENFLRDIPQEMIESKLGSLGTGQALSSFISKFDFLRYYQTAYKKSPKQIVGSTELPLSFDAREQWPGCVGAIRDQMYCGSCWAFSSAGMLGDRFCMHSGGEINVTLSPQDMIACNFENFGCSGGLMVNTIDYLQTEGITSDECMPYQDSDSPCDFKCINPEANYVKYYCKPGSLKISTTFEQIQEELFKKGPLMVGLSVYEDFINYASGVYHHVAGNMVGGHAIKLIGWGHDEDGSLYWICQNQWSNEWGMKGFINIAAGEIGIDSMALSCDPDIVDE